MSVARTRLTSIEATNIIGRPEIINAVRIATIREASAITWPACDATCCEARLLELLKLILTFPTQQAWFDQIIYYVVVNNPQIDWENYMTDIAGIEAEIDIACFAAIYRVVGCTPPGIVTVTSDPETLTEATLSGAVLTLGLSHETFLNTTLSSANFTLQRAPTGLTVGSVAYVDEVTAEVTLAFDGTDFAGDITDMTITIAAAELTAGANIVSDDILITGLAESVAAVSTPASLTEGNLLGAVIRLTLTNETYATVIDASDFTLNNEPTGVAIADVSRVSDTVADISLVFDGTDFDTTITNFNVTVEGTGLSRGNALITQDMTITAVVE